MPKPVEYTGLIRHSVDAKRRVQIPAKWRPAEDSAAEPMEYALILWPHEHMKDAYILVLPPEPYAKLMAKVGEMPFGDSKAGALRRWLGERTEKVQLDSVGRVCLPDGMAAKAGIKGDAVMVGTFDRFQIWSPERYEQTQESVDVHGPEAVQLMI